MNLFKKPKYLLVIFLASLAVVIFLPQFSHGNAATRVVLDTKDWIFEQLGYIVWLFTIYFPSLILKLEIQMFAMVGPYNAFTTQPQVASAWGTVRDLANMFFILILLLMSFGTILQVQGYGYRQMLSKLLLMAILVNFSKSIVAILIDFSQIVTLTFLAPVLYSLAGNVIVAMGLQKIMMMKETKETNADYSATSYLVAMILGGMMMIVTTMIIGVILIMFVMRIIALWIVVILSPLAFLARAFPKMASHYSTWESELSKNLTVGPALAFFMWLAFSIVGQGNISTQFEETSLSEVDDGDQYQNETINKAFGQVSAVADKSNMLNFVIAISLLMAGLKFASASGAAGSSIAGKASGSLQKWGSRLGRGATIGAAAGVGALAWRGTSGEGGVKGGLGQLRGLAGQGMAASGQAMGLGALQRGGLSLQAKENSRRERKQTKFNKRFEGMSDEQEKAYNESLVKGGGFLGKREAKANLAKRDLEGKAKLPPARAQEMAEAFEATGDNKSLEKLRARNMSVATPESLARQITEKGLSSVSGMDTTGMKKEHLQEILKQDPKAIATMLEAKDKADRDNFMAVLNSHIGTLSGSFADNTTELGKASLLQGKFDSDNVHAAFTSASPTEQAEYAKNLATSTKAEDLVKIDGTSDLFKQVALAAAASDPSKANEMYNRAKDENQREVIVNSHVSVGNIQNVINNPAIDKNLINETEILNNFDAKITAAVGRGASRFDASSQIAQRTPNFAHLAFADRHTGVVDDVEFSRFAQGLRYDDLLKLDKNQLARLVAANPLPPAGSGGTHTTGATGLTEAQLELLKKNQGIT